MSADRFPAARRLCIAFSILVICAACGGASGGSESGTTAAPAALSYPSPQTYVVGTPVGLLQPTVTGAVSSYSVSPALPAGLSLNVANGQISGTPSSVTAAANYLITAQNNGGTTTFNLSIVVTAADVFALEPPGATTIGAGQSINLFATLQGSSDVHPVYVDPAQIAWSSSQPGLASININGIATGINAGTSTITAHYRTYSNQLTIHVAGTFVQRPLSVPGQGNRSYVLYTPPFASNIDSHPALLSLHGGGGSAMIQAATSRLAELAYQHGLYVVFLNGTGAIQTFNAGSCCGSAQTQNIDDVAYVSAVLDDIQTDNRIDAARIYATGFSNGGMMSHRLACSLANRIAGIAAVAGGSPEFDQSGNRYYTCNAARPIPVLHIHATNDRNYPFEGGVGEGLSATAFYAIDATIADWRGRNNVSAVATVANVTATTTCYRYDTIVDASRPSAPVTLCKSNPQDVYDPVNKVVFGGGHSWPGGSRSPAANSDVPLVDFNAGQYLWKFFNP